MSTQYQNTQWSPELIAQWAVLWNELYNKGITWQWRQLDLVSSNGSEVSLVTSTEGFNGEGGIPLPPLNIIRLMISEAHGLNPNAEPEEELESTPNTLFGTVTYNDIYELLVDLENGIFGTDPDDLSSPNY